MDFIQLQICRRCIIAIVCVCAPARAPPPPFYKNINQIYWGPVAHFVAAANLIGARCCRRLSLTGLVLGAAGLIRARGAVIRACLWRAGGRV